MSLYKQLWISLILLMIASFIGSFYFSCISAKNYLEEQLSVKNIDNATTLALSLSSSPQDSLTMELFVNSQFDLGHYQFISLVDSQGQIIAVQYDDRDYREAPVWLTALFPINIKPGIANVSNGWQQVATLTLSSHVRFAYKQLWSNVKQLFYYFSLITLTFGVLGSVTLRWLTKPLQQAVSQANAIGNKRFVTTKEPRTLEFRAVIRSLNKLSAHVQNMLEDESSKLENHIKKTQRDEVTGLYNREPLLGHLTSLLNKQDEYAHGALILVRIIDLLVLNQKEGRQEIDLLLSRFGITLTEVCASHSSNGLTGRLNGSDFLVVLPACDDAAESAGREIYEKLLTVCRECGLGHAKLLASSTAYYADEDTSKILTRLDNGLQNAAYKETPSCIFIDAKVPTPTHVKQHDWRQYLNTALSKRLFNMQLVPVYSVQKALIHWEASLQLLDEQGSYIQASAFMPHVSRLGLSAQLDYRVVEMAIDHIKKNAIPLAIHLSASTLTNPPLMGKISALIQQNSQLSHYLSIQFSEHGVCQNIDGLRAFCQLLAPYKCKVGIEHAGQEIKHIGKVHDLGLHYVKIDQTFIQNINDTPAYQVYLRGFCSILHSIGLQALAMGVSHIDEWEALVHLGIDGGAGKYFADRPEKSQD